MKNIPDPTGTAIAIVGSTPIAAQTPASITLRGVRTHNLKAVDLDLPLKRMIVVTGPSGAGKSSLALDTLYAEGHRRYVETFSPYTRQFLARLDKPDAELIAGIPPAIAVGPPRGRHSPRSTVGTITEVHHALGSLFARAGQVVCRQCGQLVAPASPETVSRAIERLARWHPLRNRIPARNSHRNRPSSAARFPARARVHAPSIRRPGDCHSMVRIPLCPRMPPSTSSSTA